MTNTKRVYWYTCDCEWTTKYCDEYHMAAADVPYHVLEEWKV